MGKCLSAPTSERSTSSNTGFEEINNATSTIQLYQYQPLIRGHAAACASSNAQEEEEEEKRRKRRRRGEDKEEGTFVPDFYPTSLSQC